MKGRMKLICLVFLILLGTQGIFASLCQRTDGYYDQCDYSYNNVNENYYLSDHVHIYDGAYCYNAYGNSYYCHKEYYHSGSDDCNDEHDYYYNRNYISIHYRDIYGNYVTEQRPDYTRYYAYSSPVYNNPYYPDYYIYKNTVNTNQVDNTIIYVY